MITGELKNKVDQVWDAFWSGGISNPLSVVEQITYLLFIKRLDEIHTRREKKAKFSGKKIVDPVFGPKQQDFRWSRFKDMAPAEIFELFRRPDGVFDFMKNLHTNGDSSYAQFMKDAVFMIPTASLLDRVIGMLDSIPMDDRDTKGDLYEYILSNLSTAGKNGQFRTPRHIIKMMVEMMAPKPDDLICDPASGTCGFLMAAGEYLRDHRPKMFTDRAKVKHFNERMFTAYDFDATMLRIGAMNLLLHGIEQPTIQGQDSLSEEMTTGEAFTLVLANPPFKGSIDEENISKSLRQMVKTKKTELLFASLFLRLLKPGGRCACIVPDGVLFGSSKAHKFDRSSVIRSSTISAADLMEPPGGVWVGIRYRAILIDIYRRS